LVEKLPNEPQAQQARDLLDQTYLQERNARYEQLDREQSEKLQKDLTKGKELYNRMIQHTKDGLTAKGSRSESLFKGAIADGQAVLKEIDRLAEKYKDDPKVQDGAVKYRQLTTDQMVEAHLHLASSYTVSSSYKDALRSVNAALALEPKNEQA